MIVKGVLSIEPSNEDSPDNLWLDDARLADLIRESDLPYEYGAFGSRKYGKVIIRIEPVDDEQ